MGTSSRIGIRNSDDSVVSIYCHWDGYPDHNGRILVEHYTDEAKVRELMALGNLSTLGANIGSQRGVTSPTNECNAYGRDRGDSDNEAFHSTSVQEFVDVNWNEEYYYIFHYGRWMVFSTEQHKWVLVTDVLDQIM